MDLKHPQALSLQSIPLSICVFPPLSLHVQTWDVQETERTMQRIRNHIPKSQTLTASSFLTSWWAMLGKTIWVKAMPGWKGILAQSISKQQPPSTKKIASNHAVLKENWGAFVFVLHKIAFLKTAVYSRAPCCHVDLTCAPTRGKSSIHTQRWIYVF